MRIEDIAPALRPLLEPIEGRPHVRALRTPPTPRRLDLGSPATFRLLEVAAARLGELCGAMRAWPNRDLLTRTLARREAVQSSQIEGTRAGLDEVLAYEVTRSADGHGPDVAETQRYVDALQVGLDAVRAGGRRALTIDLVHRMHAVLMRDRRPPVPLGEFRTEPAWIGSGRIEDARFVPTLPVHIPAAMAAFEADLLQYAPREDDLVALGIVHQVAIAHAQLETIHPYTDGNGRTGRLLMPLLFDTEGLPPLYLSGYLLRHRRSYYDALNQLQLRSEWEPWVQLLCRAIIASVDEVLSLRDDLAAVESAWMVQVSGFRSDAVARRLPPLLIGHPVVDVNTVRKLLDVSDPAARKGVDHLLTLGILASPGERKWGRTFHASAVLERLNRSTT